VCYLVTHPERATAEPITALVADRVRELRNSSGLSQAELAAKMVKLGIPWTRLTVVNLEKRSKEARERGGAGGRDAVTAQELLALATVFDVPLPWLLIDPMAVSAVPIAKGVEVDPWTALLWLVGKEPLTDPPGPTWDTASRVIGQACQVATLVERHAQLRTHQEIAAIMLVDRHDLADRGAEDEGQERRVLESLARLLAVLEDRGYPRPPLPCDLIKRAADLGVELNGEG